MSTDINKATPRPWTYHANYIEVSNEHGDHSLYAPDDRGAVSPETRWANARFVVQAVNAHDSLMGWAEAYRDHLGGVHGKCDMDDDERCRAEQYGDGNVGEHEDCRQVSADLKQVHAALAKAEEA